MLLTSGVTASLRQLGIKCVSVHPEIPKHLCCSSLSGIGESGLSLCVCVCASAACTFFLLTLMLCDTSPRPLCAIPGQEISRFMNNLPLLILSVLDSLWDASAVTAPERKRLTTAIKGETLKGGFVLLRSKPFCFQHFERYDSRTFSAIINLIYLIFFTIFTTIP